MSLQDELHEPAPDSEWDSPMEFSLHIGLDCATNNMPHKVDICKFLSGQPIDCPTALSSEFAYFSRSEFPPPTNPSSSNPFATLRIALEAAARQAGFKLVSSGAVISKKMLEKRKYPLNAAPPYASIRFTCNQFRAFRKRKSSTNCGTLAETGLVGDGIDTTNDCGNGGALVGADDVGVAVKGRRRRKTQKSLSNDQTCSFNFAVFVDKCGFLLKKVALTSSNSMRHCHHRKCLPHQIPTKRKQLSTSMDEDPTQALDSVGEDNQGTELIPEPLTVISPNEGLHPSEFIQQMKQEIHILEGLVHSRNFCPSYLNMRGCLDELKRTNSTIRAKLFAASNHNNKGQNWDLANVAMTTSNKRQKGSQAG